MRVSRLLSRGLLATAAAFTLGLGGAAAAAHAEEYFTLKGDFSWRATEVKRLANCAASEWFDGKQGSDITDCNNAGSDPYWDGVHLSAAEYMEIDAERVPYQGGGCPPKHGFAYIKCFYVDGGGKGNPVMTVSAVSYGNGGMTARVSWYYL